MGDLKNKFMGILFEDDPETEIGDENMRVDSDEIVTVESKISAKDLLYRKSSDSPFIDLDESPKDIEDYFDEPKEYEMSAQISPIFGVISKEEKKMVEVAPEVTKSQTTKPVDSHLDIITSPIYGYGNKEDAMDNNYDVKGINASYKEENDEDLDNLIDNEEPIEVDVMSDDSFYEDEVSLFRLFGEDK